MGSSEVLSGNFRRTVDTFKTPFQEKDMIFRRSLFAVCSAAAVMSAAPLLFAQELGVYVAIDGGQSKYKTTTAELGINGGSVDLKDKQVGIAIGSQLTKQFAVELGYTDFGKARFSGQSSVPCVTGQACVAIIVDLSGNASAKSSHLSLVANASLTDTLSVFARAGGARTDRSATAFAGSGVSASSKKTEPIFGLGLSYAVTNNVDATLEWKKLNSTDVDAASLGVRVRF